MKSYDDFLFCQYSCIWLSKTDCHLLYVFKQGKQAFCLRLDIHKYLDGNMLRDVYNVTLFFFIYENFFIRPQDVLASHHSLADVLHHGLSWLVAEHH